ncbi:MAG: DNRLRE domain-containing protein [Candidatus Thorarchaeota archaeon]
MKTSKRNAILCVIIAAVLMVQASAMVNSVAPNYSYTCTGRVIIAGSSPTQGISGAQVKIYNNDFGIYLGVTYTDAQGYFQKTVGYQFPIEEMSARVYKAGYPVKWDYARPSGTNVYFGNIGLTPIPPDPPDPPVIDNVQVAIGSPKQVDLSFTVQWGSTADDRIVELYWSQDSTVDSGDKFKTITASSSDTQFLEPVPESEVLYSDHSYWFKIVAKNKLGASAYTADNYGPETIVIDGIWQCTPTDDAYTQEWDQYGGSHTYNTDLLYIDGSDTVGLNARSWLRFDVGDASIISQATLYVYYDLYYPSEIQAGYSDIIDAYSSDPNWDETSITHNTAPAVYDISLDSTAIQVPAPQTATYLAWDVSAVLGGDRYISITLCGRETVGPYLYSKERPSNWPYLEVEFWGEPQESQNPADEFVNDAFDGSVTAIETTWDISQAGGTTPPDWTLDQAYGGDWDWNFINLRDSQIPAGLQTTGYHFTQSGLNIEDAFHFEAYIQVPDYSYLLQSVPQQKIGFELKDAAGLSIAEVYYEYKGHWQSDPHRIVGDIGDGTHLGDFQIDPGVVVQVRLIIQRDLDDHITICLSLWDYPGPLTFPVNSLVEGDDGRSVSSVVMKMEYSAAQASDLVDLRFFSMKQRKTIDLGRPHEDDAVFENPLREQDFDVGEVTKWFDISGSSPKGVLYEESPSDRSWRASRAEVQDTSWCIYQELGEEYDFSFEAVANQHVGFSFLARYDDSSSAVRATLRYLIEGAPGWRVVPGDWYHLPDDGNWHEVSVVTEYPLGSSVSHLQVLISGSSPDVFSAYVDETRLAIVRNTLVDDEISYGAISLGLGIIQACDTAWGYQILVMPTVIVQASQGSSVDSVRYKFSVNEGTASIQDHGIIEGNDKEYTEPDGVEYGLGYLGLYMKVTAKWLGRLICAASDIGAPWSWIIGDIVGAGIDHHINIYERNRIRPQATSGTDGQVFIDYSGSSNSIEALTSALVMQWNVVNPQFPPTLSITVEVSIGGVLFTHTMGVSFQIAIT